jgi:intracellular multiplication protein IcmL
MKLLNLTKESAEKPGAASRRVGVGVQSHVDQATAMELSRNSLARAKYEFLLRVTFVLGATQIIMAVLMVYLATRPVEERFIRTDSQGRLAEIQVLDRPIQSNQEVIQWTAKSLTNAYTLSFANYSQQLNDIKPQFTTEGWESFNQALSRAGFIENLLSGKYITSAVPSAAPTIVSEGTVLGSYGWRVQMPITISYRSSGVDQTQSIMVEVTVVQRPAVENPSGLGIAQIVTR